MNTYQQELYDNLTQLTLQNDAFYVSNMVLGDTQYQTFNYRLASYTDFLSPGATECRGTMFEVDKSGNPIRLAALPLNKFWNLYENPFTMDLDLSRVVAIEDKADGSLISTYIHDGELRLKTKGALESTQALDAMDWLNLPANIRFKAELFRLTYTHQCTVNLEWTSPTNRVVLGYMESNLPVLGIRRMATGEFLYPTDIGGYDEITDRWVDTINVDGIDPVLFIKSITEQEGIEGYVCRLDDGQRFKCKTTWYLTLHRNKDNVNNPRRLFEVVLNEASDDLRTLFHDDPLVLRQIQEMEDYVFHEYNTLVETIEKFYDNNNKLSRKDYAILGKSQLVGMQFGLAMTKYTEREVDYKQSMLKNWKHYTKDTTNE